MTISHRFRQVRMGTIFQKTGNFLILAKALFKETRHLAKEIQLCASCIESSWKILICYESTYIPVTTETNIYHFWKKCFLDSCHMKVLSTCKQMNLTPTYIHTYKVLIKRCYNQDRSAEKRNKQRYNKMQY